MNTQNVFISSCKVVIMFVLFAETATATALGIYDESTRFADNVSFFFSLSTAV